MRFGPLRELSLSCRSCWSSAFRRSFRRPPKGGTPTKSMFFLLHLLAPLIGLLRTLPVVVELHQANRCAEQPFLRNRGNLAGAVLQSLIAGEQRFFGFGVFLLAELGRSQERLRVEGDPQIGLQLLPQ